MSAPTTMWLGVISRAKAEYFMGAPAAAGGFVATDLPLNEGGYLAAIPFEGQHGLAMSRDEFRARLIKENACTYLGRGEPGANERGFATEERIANLLAIVDGCEEG